MQRLIVASLVSLAVSLFTATASAQPCAAALLNSDPEFGRSGSSSEVQQLILWDRDGTGPQEPVLVARSTGPSPQLGQVFAQVAIWDGKRWSELPGLSAITSTISHVGVYQDKLVVTGSFTSINNVPANRIALFDGQTWTALGAGLPTTPTTSIEFNGSLYVGGPFRAVGAVAGNGIVRWDGTRWRSLDGGVGGVATPSVNAMVIDGNTLVAGGDFLTAGKVAARNIARYDPALNAWDTMGELPGTNPIPTSLANFGGKIYAIGGLSLTTPPFQCAAYDGTNWEGLPLLELAGNVSSLSVFNGSLHLGFVTEGSISRSVSYARFDGEQFLDVVTSNLNQTIRSLAPFAGRVVASGSFSSFAGVNTSNIVAFDAFNTLSLGNGLSASGTPVVYDMLADGSDTYIAGTFTVIGGKPIRGLARRDAAGNYYDLGMSSDVRRVIRWDEDGPGPRGAELIAVIDRGNVIPRWGVERFRDGQWQVLASSISTVSGGTTFDLIVYEGSLYLVGQFSGVGNAQGTTITADSIARFSNGQWSSVLGGLRISTSTPAIGNAAAIFDGQLFVAGAIGTAGSTVVNNVARWNGTQWIAAGAPGIVSDLQVFDNRLYALTSSQLLIWDPGLVSWTPVLNVTTPFFLSAAQGSLFVNTSRLEGSALVPLANATFFSGSARAIVETADGRLLIGGSSLVAGPPSRTVPGLTAWAPPGFNPVITVPPASRTVCAGEEATLSVSVEQTEQTAFRWERNGVPVRDTRLLTGTATDTLRFSRVSPQDAGEYRVIITNACGVTTSIPVTLSINTACPPECDPIDFNGNGVFPEEQDVIDFFTVLSGGTCL